ncbi:hypothetical protein PIROE2DRAFT_16255, partial [Piromyces sp. E2]
DSYSSRTDDITEEDQQKIYLLRDYIKRSPKQKKSDQTIDDNENIDLRNYGAILHTVFLGPPTKELKKANKDNLSYNNGKSLDMLHNRHFSKSSGQLNTFKHQQFVNDTMKNKLASRSAQDLTTSWIVVDKNQTPSSSSAHISSPLLHNPSSLDHGIYSKLFGSNSNSNINITNKRRSYFRNSSPSLDPAKAIPDVGTSYETGVPTLESANENTSFEKSIADGASSPSLSIRSSLSASNLLSPDILLGTTPGNSGSTGGNNNGKVTTTTLNDQPEKISLNSSNKKQENKPKPSGINRYSIDSNLKQKAHELFPPKIDLGKSVGFPSLYNILHSKQKNKSMDNLYDSSSWRPEVMIKIF